MSDLAVKSCNGTSAHVSELLRWVTFSAPSRTRANLLRIYFSNESQLAFKKEELDFQVDKQLILEF